MNANLKKKRDRKDAHVPSHGRRHW